MNINKFNKELISYLKKSVTPFHCVEVTAKILNKEGFSLLSESQSWKLEDGKAYFVVRNDSSIIAFRYRKNIEKNGFRITGAHTDSPSLKLKPTQDMINEKYIQLAVEIYGGPILNTWFDRDLSIAGKVCFLKNNGKLRTTLVDFTDPVCLIPNIAPHLSRGENKELGKQKDIPPLLFQSGEIEDFEKILMDKIKKSSGNSIKKIMDHELFLYDIQSPSECGLKKEFITGGKLDNLLSCFAGLKGLIDSEPEATSLLILNDHEETGSTSTTGANGSFLLSVLERITSSENKENDSMWRSFNKSMVISADNAHGVHPNYKDKFDPSHKPVLNGGPVIKYNANQRYASNCETTSVYKLICERAKVPVQSFVMRNDIPCGSTIGPVTSAKTGIKTIDVGVPTFGMHSIRETAGIKDCFYLYKSIAEFNSMEDIPLD